MHNLAYVAGFIDGEGCFSIAQNGSISLGIVNTSRSVLEFIKHTLGCGVVQDRTQRVNKNQFVYRVYGDECVSVITKLLPYLVEKKDEAALILEFRQEPRALRISGIKGQFKNHARDIYRTELMRLKKRESPRINV